MDRRQYIALAGTGLTIGVAGCSDTDESPEPVDDEATGDGDTDPNGEDGSDESNGSEPEEVSVGIGELVEGDQMSLVVERFERDADLGEFYDADPGNEFAIASIALKNTSDEFLTVSNLLQTRVRDDEDFQYSQTFAGGDEATFNDGQFVPGEVERGGIPFEIPEDASGLELVFDFDLSVFGGIERATIDLERESDQIHRLEQNLRTDVYDVGETIGYGDVEVTVNDVYTESNLGMFAEPDSGNEYFIVDISISNNTGEEQRFSTMLQMMVKDEEGQTYQEDFSATSELSRAFDEGTPLSDGETRRGELAYEVEEGLSPLYWVFEFDLIDTGDKTFWNVQ